MLKLWRENRKLRKAVKSLEGRLAVEVDRNRAREDELVNRVLTSRGEFGLSVPHAPIAEKQPEGKLEPEKPQSAAFDADMQDFFIEDAIAHGLRREDGLESYEMFRKDGMMPYERAEQ